MDILAETFKKAEDFDFEAFVKESYRKNEAGGMHIQVEFLADMSTVQQRIPAVYGTLTPTSNGVLLEEQYDDIEGMARYLMVLNLPFVIHNPPQLREALLRLGERMVQIASASPPPRDNFTSQYCELPSYE